MDPSHTNAEFFLCVFMPLVRKANISLSAGSLESTENQEFLKNDPSKKQEKISGRLANLEIVGS